MGIAYGVKCTQCDYSIRIAEGIGMKHSCESIFYGSCVDLSHNRKPASDHGIPLLYDLVEDKNVKEIAFALLEEGATPGDYGHELYACPKCFSLFNLFHFQLSNKTGDYSPVYTCGRCQTLLKRALIKSEQKKLKIVYRNGKGIQWRCPQCSNDSLEYSEFYILCD